MWIPRKRPNWELYQENRFINFKSIRKINDKLLISIHDRATDNKIMVSLFNEKDRQNFIWTMDEFQFLDLCQYLASEIDGHEELDGKKFVLQVTMEIYGICGLQTNLGLGNPDKIDDIIDSYKKIIPDHIWDEWKKYINFLTVFFYSRDEYRTKSGNKSKYGRAIGLTGIIALLKYDIPPEIAYKIFKYESGTSVDIPPIEIERTLEKYSIPPSPCRNYDKNQKTQDDAW